MNEHRFSFVTVFPELIQAYFRHGVLSRAVNNKIVDLNCVQLRDFAIDRHGSIDDRPYGGGEGMVMRPEPLSEAIEHIGGAAQKIILPSPRGKKWDANVAQQFAEFQNIIFICPRYSGVDQRFIERFHAEEYSLGDFVVSGGEMPALMFADSICRHIPGVLGDSLSAEQDSFSPGMQHLLEYPLYTRPESIWGMKVPEVLLSGDHQAIQKWRTEQSIQVTKMRRRDLIE